MSQQLRRDSFARATLIKCSPENVPCAWCGQTDGKGRTYIYYWESDGSTGRPHPRYSNMERFCSVACFEAYNS